MSVINLLDRETSNLIAAGEVVERPCSVVKELLENAIDAHSTAVTVEIRNGGTTLMRVTDNGCGMVREDVELCIRRHATSKIKNPSDLDDIGTLGFRGEALAAISSVSRFTVLSKRAEDELGTQLISEGDSIISIDEAGCPDGTTILVRDLFFNQPARKKFLKRDVTEAAAVLQFVERIALSHPEISFKYICDGETKLNTSGNGELFDAVYAVFGKDFASSVTKAEAEENGMRVSGYVSRPEYARSNRSYQSFFINGRFVKSKTMFFALEDAFKSYVKSDKFPGCVLFLELGHGDVDVNVHPAKTEVRFKSEREVYNIIYKAVRAALTSLDNPISENKKPDDTKAKLIKAAIFGEAAKKTSQISFVEAVPMASKKSEPSTAILKSEEKKPPEKAAEPLFKTSIPATAKLSSTGSVKAGTSFPNKYESLLYDIKKPEIADAKDKVFAFPEIKDKTGKESFAPGSSLPVTDSGEQNKDNPLISNGCIRGVLFDAYICYEAEDTLYLIDKHAAHERILYEKLKKQRRDKDVQLLLDPIIVSFTPTDADTIEAGLSEIGDAGFILDRFGANEFALRGVPTALAGLPEDALRSLLEKMASDLKSGGRASAADDLIDRMLFTAACKAAVKAGIPDDRHDYEWIVESLRKIDNIVVCPHGRPIIIEIPKGKIEKLFLRN